MARLHQNNFATNLTSAVSSGDTTSPLNSIPTIAAPFYLAFDATNLNSHYEVVDCTSKSATNVNHAALTYAHTTAEEVRMIVPAVEMDLLSSGKVALSAPEGFLVNGKISVTDAAGITLAIKTLAGTDPSASDPVYVRIDDTVRSITSALSVAKADGTNWFNAGSAEFATKEIDYFAYLGYNATDGVVIGFSRIPSANSYNEFSVTTTNEKYCAISTITNAAATDHYEVIGRFAATLSAGAGYTWTVPTYTAKNLIQRPIYETRYNTFVPTLTRGGGAYSNQPTSIVGAYRVVGKKVYHDVSYTQHATPGSSGNQRYTLPFTPVVGNIGMGLNVSTVVINFPLVVVSTAYAVIWASGAVAECTASQQYQFNGIYEI